jgi:hypothetical protein
MFLHHLTKLLIGIRRRNNVNVVATLSQTCCESGNESRSTINLGPERIGTNQDAKSRFVLMGRAFHGGNHSRGGP